MARREQTLILAARALRLVVPLLLGALVALGGGQPAHARPVRVALDPGHGGREIGAAYRFADGTVLQEKALNLRVALRLRELLKAQGYDVTLTRTTDAPVNAEGRDLNGDGRVSLAGDLQARIDIANRAQSDLMLSVHLNGVSDPQTRGTYTFWNPDRRFAAQNRALAERVQEGLVRSLQANGYTTRDMGARTDASVLDGDAYFLLGPQSSTIARPSQMPAIIGEALFLTNASDATALRDDRTIEAIARGYLAGIRAYTAGQPADPTPARPASSREFPAMAPIVASSTSRERPAVSSPSAPATPPATGFWSVWTVTYRDSDKGNRLSTDAADKLSRGGIASGVLVSSEFPNLQPGYRVVFAGPFTTRAAAEAALPRVKAAGYQDAYIRYVQR